MIEQKHTDKNSTHTQPLESEENIRFEDLFTVADLQKLQDEFAEATGIASIITSTDGVPVTKPSNFCRLCKDIIRKTDQGLKNCYKSDAILGKVNVEGPTIQPCMSGGLWDAGVAIVVGGNHIANWLIGQVRDETQNEDQIRRYANKIGADENETVQAFNEVPAMSRERFEKISNVLHLLANQLSSTAYQNIQQARFIEKIRSTEKALTESENKFKSLFEKMAEMVVIHELVFDSEGNPVDYKIIDCNSAFTKVTGLQKEAVINNLASAVYQVNSAPYLEEFSKVALTGEPFEYTTYFQPMDKHFQISVISPKINTFATITTDVTAMRQYNDMLIQKNNELENYLYVASHDLRTPLVNIQGFSTRLQKQTEIIKDILFISNINDDKKDLAIELADKKIPQSLEYIFTNVSRMDNLINSLLQISRTGRVLMTITEIDAESLFKKVITSLDYQLKEVNAHLEIDKLDNCYGDENLLIQMFSNILSNSVKYRNKSRDLIIKISSKKQYKKIIYCVEDNGIGINQRLLEKIWDVFYRVDKNKDIPGDGIGLSIVKRIVDKHKGRVWVESQENEGSRFFVELSKDLFDE